MEAITEKWQDKYPNAMKSQSKNWDAISPILKFSSEVRKVINTTNAIESLNSTYQRVNAQRSVFPGSTALLKSLYLDTFKVAKKMDDYALELGAVYGELSIMYKDRLSQ